MHPEKEPALEHRVTSAAEAALAHHHYVSAIDVLTGMGLLAPTHVQDWRKGRIDFLERVIHTNLEKISLSMALFRQWAQAKGLKPSETRYVRRDRGETVDLRFSKSGNPRVERSYRTHFVSPELSERKKAKLEERLSRAPARVVFQILGASRCSECGIELEQGGLLCIEAGQPLCPACAGLGDLEYFPAGDAALTRRAAAHSARMAVVVRFSRSRGRYERQGILIEQSNSEGNSLTLMMMKPSQLSKLLGIILLRNARGFLCHPRRGSFFFNKISVDTTVKACGEMNASHLFSRTWR